MMEKMLSKNFEMEKMLSENLVLWTNYKNYCHLSFVYFLPMSTLLLLFLEQNRQQEFFFSLSSLTLFSGQNIFPFQNFLPCNLVRVHSLGGTIRSIYLYPVPTLLLHDKKEINVCFIAMEYAGILQNLF